MSLENLDRKQTLDLAMALGKVLLKSGATLIVSSEDIMKQYRKTYKTVLNEIAYDKARIVKKNCDEALAKMNVCSRIYGREYGVGARKSTDASLRAAQEQSLVARATVPSRKAETKPQPKAEPEAAQASKPAPGGVKTPQTENSPKSKQSAPKLNEVQMKILEQMPLDECISLDKLVMASGLPIQTVALNLTMMTVSGVVRSLPGGMYQRT